MTHDELAADLAAHLRANGDVCVWTDMQMGPVGSPRPDVYVLPKEYRGFHPLSYEVKVSVQDFRADTTRAKWQSYLPFSAGVVFACPAGLLKAADVPTGCGLIERGATGWRHKKRPTLRHVENLPIKVWQKLVIDGVERAHGAARVRAQTEWTMTQAVKRRLGERVAKILADQDAAESMAAYMTQRLADDRVRHEQDLARAKERAEELMRDSLDPQLKLLAEALGVQGFAPPNLYPLINRIHNVRRELNESAALRKAHQALRNAAHQLEAAANDLDGVRTPPAALPEAQPGA